MTTNLYAKLLALKQDFHSSARLGKGICNLCYASDSKLIVDLVASAWNPLLKDATIVLDTNKLLL